MAEDKKEVWSDWIEFDFTIPDDISWGWDYHNVQYLMTDDSIVDGQLYPDEVPFTYTDEEGDVFEDYNKEWLFVDDNDDPVSCEDVKAWRYQTE